MSRQPKFVRDIPEGLKRLKTLLDEFEANLAQPDLRHKVLSLIPAAHLLRDVGSSLVPRKDARGARARILLYFQKYPGALIDGDELMVISGIGEWARRVQELRVQEGWWIYSGNTFQQIAEDDPQEAAALMEMLGVDPASIKTHQYALVRPEQDRDAAFRWHRLNTIRKKKIAVKDKLLEYFRANVGQPVTGEELRYLANNKREWTRRTRELRTEFGWPVMTLQQGRTDLPIGSYVLEEDRQTYEHDRKIPDAVRVEVLERDGFACRACGWSRDKAQRDDPRRLLELHHIKEHVKGGTNTVGNLLTLCNVHHDDFHAGRLDLTPHLP